VAKAAAKPVEPTNCEPADDEVPGLVGFTRMVRLGRHCAEQPQKPLQGPVQRRKRSIIVLCSPEDIEQHVSALAHTRSFAGDKAHRSGTEPSYDCWT
jgi:hypothetical protein